MSAWKADTLSNDPAQDFLVEVEQAEDRWGAIRACLRKTPGPFSDDEEDSYQLAAGEIVAAALGRPLASLDDEWKSYAATAPAESLSELQSLSLAAVKRIASKSDLRDLWEDAAEDDYHDWLASLDDLVRRLGK